MLHVTETLALADWELSESFVTAWAGQARVW